MEDIVMHIIEMKDMDMEAGTEGATERILPMHTQKIEATKRPLNEEVNNGEQSLATELHG